MLFYQKNIIDDFLYKIPFEKEKIKLLEDIHIEKGYIGYIRLYKEIMNQKFFWKNIIEDCKKFS